MDFNNLKEEKGLYIYETNDFVTNKGVLYFKAQSDIKSIYIYKILEYLSNNSNKKLGDKSDISYKEKMLYKLKTGIGLNRIGKELFIKLHFSYVDENVIGEKYHDQVYSFIRDYINEINIDEESVKYVKTRILNNLKEYLNNKIYIIDVTFFKKVLKGTILENMYSLDKEEVSNILDSISVEDVKELFKKTVCNESFYLGLLVGRFNEKEVRKIREYIPYETSLNILDYKDIDYVSNEDFKFKNDSYKETIIRVCYKATSDKAYNITLKRMLNGTAGILHEILRDKYGLVYTSGCCYLENNNLLYIEAKINKENKEKTIKAINECFDILHDKEKVKYYFEYIQNQLEERIDDTSESFSALYDELEKYILKVDVTNNIFEYKEIVKNYTPEDFIKRLDKIKKTNVFYYEGGK